MNQAYVEAWGEWNNYYPAVGCEPLDEHFDAGLVALKINGKDLPYDLGGPMLPISPGMSGAFWTKWPQMIEFQVGEEPFDFVEAMGDVAEVDFVALDEKPAEPTFETTEFEYVNHPNVSVQLN